MIANIIIEQLGGARFKAMTGSYNYIDTGKGLRITLRRNLSGAKWLLITLNSLDTYDVKFIKLRKGEAITVAEYKNVYWDMLPQIYESVTGQYLKL
jgi:hypothetical protein